METYKSIPLNMPEETKEDLELKKSIIDGSGFRFVIKALPISFRTIKKQTKDKVKKDIDNILKTLYMKDAFKSLHLFSGELKVELYCNLKKRYSNTDIDNIAKFVLDCMEGLVFRNDNQIKELIVKKFRGSKMSKELIGIGISKI